MWRRRPNLGAWINRVGVWNPTDRNDWFADDGDIVMSGADARRSPYRARTPRQTWSGCWASWAYVVTPRQPLLPIGTLYDPFVHAGARAVVVRNLRGWQSILVGIAIGVTLAPEGGAHQSIITAVGRRRAAAVRCREPCFAQTGVDACSIALGDWRPDGTAATFAEHADRRRDDRWCASAFRGEGDARWRADEDRLPPA